MEESAAIHLLKKAVNFDTEKRFNEALVCYTEGIELLLKALKGVLIIAFFSFASS
jgi:hypothetical protein